MGPLANGAKRNPAKCSRGFFSSLYASNEHASDGHQLMALEYIPHRCSVSSGLNFLFAGLLSLKRRYAVEQTALEVVSKLESVQLNGL